MLNRNSKLYNQKENSYYQQRDSNFMKNSTVVDMLVESFQQSGVRNQNPPKPGGGGMFKFVSSQLSNNSSNMSDMENSQRGAKDMMKKRPSDVGTVKDRSFKKKEIREDEEDLTGLRIEVAEALQQTQTKLGAQMKSQCDMLRSEMGKNFQKLVGKLNQKITGIDKCLVRFGQEQQMLSKMFEDFKIADEQRFDQIQIKLNSANYDKLKQSGYGVDLRQSGDMLDRHIDEQMENRHQAQIAELTREIELIRQEISSKAVFKKEQEVVVGPVPTASTLDFQQVKQYVENIMRQRDIFYQSKFIQIDKNINRMHAENARLFNDHLNPRIFKLEQIIKKPVDDSTKRILDDVLKFKQEWQDKLRSSKVVNVRKPTTVEGNTLKSLSKIDMTQTYFLDQQRMLMDCNGVYLTDQKNARIKIEQDQVCFLAANGLMIRN